MPVDIFWGSETLKYSLQYLLEDLASCKVPVSSIPGTVGLRSARALRDLEDVRSNREAMFLVQHCKLRN